MSFSFGGAVPARSLCTICSVDGDTSPATVFCLDCSHLLCQQCQDRHEGNSQFKKHVTLAVSEASSEALKCSSHPQQLVSSYCVRCDVNVCSLCVMKKHHGHDTKHLKQVLAELTADDHRNLPGMKRAQRDLQEQDRDMEEGVQQLQRVFDRLTQRIVEHSDTLVARIMQQRDAALGVFAKEFQARKNKFLERQQDIKDPLTKLDEVLSRRDASCASITRLTNSSGDRSNDKEILDEAQSLMSKSLPSTGEEWCPEFIRNDDASLGSVRLGLYSDVVDITQLYMTRQVSRTPHSVSKVTAYFSVSGVLQATDKLVTTPLYVRGLPWSITLIPPKFMSRWWGAYLVCSLNVNSKWSCKVQFSISLCHPSGKGVNTTKASLLAKCDRLQEEDTKEIIQTVFVDQQKPISFSPSVYQTTTSQGSPYQAKGFTLGSATIPPTSSAGFSFASAAKPAFGGSTSASNPVSSNISFGQTSAPVLTKPLDESPTTFCCEDPAWGYQNFIEKDALEGFLRDDALILKVTITSVSKVSGINLSSSAFTSSVQLQCS